MDSVPGDVQTRLVELCASLSLDALDASRRDEFRLFDKMPGANQPALSHVHSTIHGSCKACSLLVRTSWLGESFPHTER
jgi:hypothetical protein